MDVDWKTEQRKLEELETCPECGMSIIVKKPDGIRQCCNRECRHQWEVKIQ